MNVLQSLCGAVLCISVSTVVHAQAMNATPEATRVSSWVRAFQIEQRGLRPTLGFNSRVAFTPDGGTVACIEHNRTLTVEGSVHSVSGTLDEPGAATLVKVTPTGAVQWSRRSGLRFCTALLVLSDGRIVAGGSHEQHTVGSAAMVLFDAQGTMQQRVYAAPGIDAVVSSLLPMSDGTVLFSGLFSAGLHMHFGGHHLRSRSYYTDFAGTFDLSGTIRTLRYTQGISGTPLPSREVVVREGHQLRFFESNGQVRWNQRVRIEPRSQTTVLASAERVFVFCSSTATTTLQTFSIADGRPLFSRVLANEERYPLGISQDRVWIAHTVPMMDSSQRNPLPGNLTIEAMDHNGVSVQQTILATGRFALWGHEGTFSGAVNRNNTLIVGASLWTRGWDESASAPGMLQINLNLQQPQHTLDQLPFYGRLAITGHDCSMFGGDAALSRLVIEGLPRQLQQCSNPARAGTEFSATLRTDGTVSLSSIGTAAPGFDADGYRFDCVQALFASVRVCPRSNEVSLRAYTNY